MVVLRAPGGETMDGIGRVRATRWWIFDDRRNASSRSYSLSRAAVSRSWHATRAERRVASAPSDVMISSKSAIWVNVQAGWRHVPGGQMLDGARAPFRGLPARAPRAVPRATVFDADVVTVAPELERRWFRPAIPERRREMTVIGARLITSSELRITVGGGRACRRGR